MTQLFDEESGSVTPVTVIQAGPCPVVAVRTPDADGYEAVQLAWDLVADRKISKPERGHLAKAGSTARTGISSSSAAPSARRCRARTSRSRSSSPGTR